MSDDNRRLLIGLGTGRCGTVSLSSLLNAQPDTTVIHEGAIGGERHLLPWDRSGDAVRWLLDLANRTGSTRWFGDVGMYFLPYVEEILSEWPDARFIALRRDREETVQSYLKKTAGRNHWVDHDGTEWRLDERWDPAFPKYPPMPKEEALRKYWNDYYQRVSELEQIRPDSIRMFEMSMLNSYEGKEVILSFAGYTPIERRIDGYYHQNTETTPRHRERTITSSGSSTLKHLLRRFRIGGDEE